MTSEDVGWQIASTLATERTLSDDPCVRHCLHWSRDVLSASAGEVSKTALAKEYGVSRETLYQYLKADAALGTA
jgi:hypothetical protein